MARAPWSEALELQEQSRQFYASPLGQQQFYALLSQTMATGGRVGTDSTLLGTSSKLMLAGVVRGEPYFWLTPMCYAVEDIARSVPMDFRFDRDIMPVESAYMVFEKPLALRPGTNQDARIRMIDEEGVDAGVRVLAMSHGMLSYEIDAQEDESKRGVLMVSVHAVVTRQNLAVRTWRPEAIGMVPMPMLGFTIKYGETVSAVIEAERYTHDDHEGAFSEADEVDENVRYLAAIFALLNQRIAVARPEQADRAARRRLIAGGLEDPPPIRVVTLRKYENPVNYEDSDEPVNWSHRWLVKPHFRNQPYGEGRRETKRILILGYIKGPADKPLKADGGRLFNVVR